MMTNMNVKINLTKNGKDIGYQVDGDVASGKQNSSLLLILAMIMIISMMMVMVMVAAMVVLVVVVIIVMSDLLPTYIVDLLTTINVDL